MRAESQQLATKRGSNPLPTLWIDCPQDLEIIELREVIKGLPAQFGKS